MIGIWSLLSTLARVGVAAALTLLVPPILWPDTREYPWEIPPDERDIDKKCTVVIAGSFNPPHKGHEVMIEYLCKRYGKVFVVIGMNPDKAYQVSPKKRAELVETMLKDKPAAANLKVEVVPGYIWRFAKREGATIFFRGIRTWEKDGQTERSLQILNTWGPLLLGPFYWPIPTVYLQGNPEYNHVSSSLIRKICGGKEGADKEALSKLVPAVIADSVAKLYAAQTPPKDKKN